MVNSEKIHYEEMEKKTSSGMFALIVITLFILVGTAVFVYGIILLDGERDFTLGLACVIGGTLVGFIICPIFYMGLKIIKPNEAIVLTLFGKYVGTIKKEGFFYVNPFCVGVNPAQSTTTQSQTLNQTVSAFSEGTRINVNPGTGSRKISLKASTLNNEKQKVNDQLGNPIMIGIVVIWKVVNTAKAVFNVDNYKEFLSIQCDSALRNIVRLYPYDSYNSGASEDAGEKSLHGSSQEIAVKLKEEIQSKVEIAGLEIQEARITNLYYAPEIAAAMLQRQQASAVVDARQLIVQGAVGMVEMALSKLNETGIVKLDEERKAAMVSNLLVVLCGNRDAQPVVNSGSLY
ncbi:MAG: SPFH domain-containing protein [Treponema sp.]|nr:SPFH domain-containing protein [Treponema sp.]